MVRSIFRKFTGSGKGLSEIAVELNHRGHVTGGGGPWTNRAIRLILDDEAYMGTLVYGRTTNWMGRVGSNVPEENWVRVQGAIPAIVTRAMFLRAQKRIAAKMFARTKEAFLEPLEALLDREGYLTAGLINAQTNMPNAKAYYWRFRGLMNAYRLVGYDSPFAHIVERMPAQSKAPDNETLLDSLRSLLAREGYLTTRLIDKAPGMPSRRAYEWRFGKLSRAYELIGYEPPTRVGRPKCDRAALAKMCATI